MFIIPNNVLWSKKTFNFTSWRKIIMWNIFSIHEKSCVCVFCLKRKFTVTVSVLRIKEVSECFTHTHFILCGKCFVAGVKWKVREVRNFHPPKIVMLEFKCLIQCSTLKKILSLHSDDRTICCNMFYSYFYCDGAEGRNRHT